MVIRKTLDTASIEASLRSDARVVKVMHVECNVYIKLTTIEQHAGACVIKYADIAEILLTIDV